MDKENLPIKSPRQLKDWINNTAKKNNLVANTVLQNYMMERFLERVAISKYSDNFILKGGFLIAAMVGIDMRSTMDMDTTIKGLPISETEIEKIISDILTIPVDDNVTFELKSIKHIHDEGEYEDFRIGVLATFFTMKINLKLDITTGDIIIPKEVDYAFKLMFEDRTIQIKAYNLNTILAEKIESILVRNISNTRARDFYDIYILFTTRSSDINKSELYEAIVQKSKERNSLIYVENYDKYINDIKTSKDLIEIWTAYKNKYSYAKDIEFLNIIRYIEEVFGK